MFAKQAGRLVISFLLIIWIVLIGGCFGHKEYWLKASNKGSIEQKMVSIVFGFSDGKTFEYDFGIIVADSHGSVSMRGNRIPTHAKLSLEDVNGVKRTLESEIDPNLWKKIRYNGNLVVEFDDSEKVVVRVE